MKFVIQRVKHAEVAVDGQTIGQIGKGLLILFGAGEGDTRQMARKYAEKIVKLRIFEDECGKTNLALADVGGEVLVISQFTLYADCRKGNRPSFINAAPPQEAEALYDYFVDCIRELTGKAETGSFGADMKVELCNDGPFTIVLDSTTDGILKD